MWDIPQAMKQPTAEQIWEFHTALRRHGVLPKFVDVPPGELFAKCEPDEEGTEEYEPPVEIEG